MTRAKAALKNCFKTPKQRRLSFVLTSSMPGVLPYMGYLGMCGSKGYGFTAVLVANKVSILPDFGYVCHK